MRVISLRIVAVLFETTTGSTTSERSETMMNTTGTTVVQVLSGPTRQMLRRLIGLFETTDVRYFVSKGLTKGCQVIGLSGCRVSRTISNTGQPDNLTTPLP